MPKRKTKKISVVIKALSDSAKKQAIKVETAETSEYDQELDNMLDSLDVQENQQWGFYYST